MISSVYTLEPIEQEDGPNLYWKGCVPDYLKIVNALHNLGCKADLHIRSTELDLFTAESTVMAFESVSNDSDTQLFVREQNGLVRLKFSVASWQLVLYKTLSVSFFPSFNYIDLDTSLVEMQMNFIVSSEKDFDFAAR